MAISLFAMPVSAASCPLMPVAKAGMACCGSACHCPAEKMCAKVPAPKADRTTGQPLLKISVPAAILLYALDFKLAAFSRQPVQVTVGEASPPPLMTGSPPQAQLRVWLL